MEDDLLAGEVLVIILGEGDVEILLVAGLHADDLILKAGDEAAGAELELVILALTALERFAVVEALEVDDGDVALLGLAVDGDEAGVALGHLIEALLDIVGADLDLFLLSRQALVFAELDLGIHGNGRLEGEAVLVDLVVHDLDLGIADNIEAALADGLRICLGQGDVNGIAVENARAVELFDHLAGGLAGAEAGNAELAAGLGVGLGNGGFKFLRADLDGHRDSALFQLFNIFDSHDFFFLRLTSDNDAFAKWNYTIASSKFPPFFASIYVLIANFYRLKGDIIRRDQRIFGFFAHPLERAAVRVAVQMPVIAALDLVFVEKLEHLGTLVALIDGRIVQKAVDGLPLRRLERRFKPQRLAREHLARVRARGILFIKPAARAADGVVAVEKGVVVEDIERCDVVLGEELLHLRRRAPPVVVVAL